MNDERYSRVWHGTTDYLDEFDDMSPDPAWDPAEELAYLLQKASQEEAAKSVAHPRDEASVTAPEAGSPMRHLQDITAELPPVRGSRRGHRRRPARRRPGGLRIVSFLIAALAAIIVSMVSVFSGLATYEPLLVVTSRGQGGADAWWPMLVYGPWTAGSLSILRAALHQRRAVHSWFVVLLFSSVAVLLCVVQAPRTIEDTAAAALPGAAALACFQQLVRQITLTRPPRRSTPRHRSRIAPERLAPPPPGGGNLL
ncbi:hypothetical protein ABZX30_21160 [Streptomyces sp. NPDC004542]|uniref:hypothetical protein n=1 Tax=Streptomyces sp. NPDC004542 TaxID=3154281 RepID=UPI00339E86A5